MSSLCLEVEVAGFDLCGHPGEKDLGNWIMFAKAGRVLSIPWIAAGGTADGSQLAAALGFGAAGVNMGTAFMATQDCKIDDSIKQALVSGSEDDTELLMRGYNTLRVFKNSASTEAKQLELSDPAGHSKNKRFRELVADNPDGRARKAFEGSLAEDDAVWSAGQVMTLIDSVPSCEELCQRMVDEAVAVLERGPSLIARM